MNIELDNKKMWESLYRYGHKYEHFEDAIQDALKDQGLHYNPDTKKIESIEPEFKIRAGNVYVCTRSCGHHFFVGDLAYCDVDGDLGHKFNATERYHIENAYLYFRPATPEEIPHEDYHWNGEIRVRKVTGVLKKMLDNIDEEELAKTREEMTKESSDGELTELELHFGQFVYGDAWAKREIDDKEKTFVKLCIRDIILPAARKQLQPEIDAEIEQAYKNQDEVQYRNGYNKCVEDARNAFCKTCKIGKCNSSECVYLNDFKKALIGE